MRRDFGQGCPTPDERGQGEPFSSASVEFKDGTAHIRTCFTAGTKIKTQSGYKAIETIQSGDIVASANEHTGKISYKKVVQTFIRQTPRIYKLTYNDGTTVETTGDHPFYIQGKGWITVDKLSYGDISPTWAALKKSSGVVEKEIALSESQDTISDRVSRLVMKESLAVVDIEVIEEETTVYNFEVEDDHTYFVTEAEVWVHNSPDYDKKMKLVKIAMTDEVLIRDSLLALSEKMVGIDLLGADKSPAGILGIVGKAGAETINFIRTHDNLEIDDVTKIMVMEAIEAEEDIALRELEVKNVLHQRETARLKDVIYESLSKTRLSSVVDINRIESELAVKRAEILIQSNPTYVKKLQAQIDNLQKAKDSMKNLTELNRINNEDQLKFAERMAGLGYMKIIASEKSKIELITSYGAFATRNSTQFNEEILSISTFRDSFKLRQNYPDNLLQMFLDSRTDSAGFQVEQNFENYINTRNKRNNRYCLEDSYEFRICR